MNRIIKNNKNLDSSQDINNIQQIITRNQEDRQLIIEKSKSGNNILLKIPCKVTSGYMKTGDISKNDKGNNSKNYVSTPKRLQFQLPQNRETIRITPIGNQFVDNKIKQKNSLNQQKFNTKKNQINFQYNNIETQKKSRKLSIETNSLDQLIQIFKQQKQLFEKQKQQLKADILIKQSQIQILQKIISQNLLKNNQSINQFDFFQIAMIQKDKQIQQLIKKISFMNNTILQKSQNINSLKYQNMNLISTIESLQNQLYTLVKKQNVHDINVALERSKRTNTYHQYQGPDREIDQVDKRLEILKLNRLEIEKKTRMKSQKINSGTSRSKYKFNF